jgi:ribosomal protein L11 methyltransferase
LVKPTWETDAEIRDGDMVIEIDPGTAFGTGSHETTWLCIEGLRDVVTKDTAVLDIGCGSGILSIVAMKLGAAYAVGVDIDPIAVDVSKENATQNGLSLFEAEVPEIKPGTVSFFAGDVLSDEAFCEALTLEKYPVVVANILADVIMPLAPVVKRFLTKYGVFLCSGILNTREEEVRASLAKDGYEVIGVRRKNDWVSLLARAL